MHLHPRLSLSSFLSTAKSTLASYNASQTIPSSPGQNPLTFVIGNESAERSREQLKIATKSKAMADVDADLDSLCSAMVLAYMMTYFSKRLYIPLSNIPRSELPLRRELFPVLRHAIAPDDLITLSDLPTPLPTPAHTRWILVDHNALTGKLGQIYGERVLGCIDHHKDEERVPFGPQKGEGLEHEPRIIQETGSCSSLVTAWARRRRESASAKKDVTMKTSSTDFFSETRAKAGDEWDTQLARLALGPILIDTACLRSSKTTAVDIAATAFLEQLIVQHEGSKYDRETFYNQISATKEDLSPFTLAEIMRKDYKQWDDEVQVPGKSACNLGSAAVVQPVEYLLDRAGSTSSFLSVLLEFMRERDVCIFALMTTSRSEGQLLRELFIWSIGEKAVQAAQKFELEAGPRLGLEICDEQGLNSEDINSAGKDAHQEEIMWRRLWKQKNVENSRKQIAPLLRDAIRKSDVFKL